MNPLQFVLVCIAGWMNLDQQCVIEYLHAENRVLREMIPKKRLRFTQQQRLRLAQSAKAIRFSRLKEIATAVTPETLMNWIRTQIGKKYDGSSKRGVGRPGTNQKARNLVVKLAKENPSWGYSKILGVAKSLGYVIGRTTIREILLKAGIQPAPERRRGKSWKSFLKTNWSVMAATDFFTVELLTPICFQRYSVMMVMHLATRRVHLAGIVLEPTGAWVDQIGRGLGGFLNGQKYLLHDRSPVFTEKFSTILDACGVKTKKLPALSPNLNAHMERWIRGLRDDCLNHLVLMSERALRETLEHYVEHFHHERPHQGMENKVISPHFNAAGPVTEIRCRRRLGGLLNYYHPNDLKAA